MEQDIEPYQDLPVKPTHRGKLLFVSLAITALTISLYILLSILAEWLPEAYGDIFLNLAGPFKDLPAEGVWLVQSAILRILLCGFGVLLLYGLIKLFRSQKLSLPFIRMTGQHRASLNKNIVIYFVIVIAQTILFYLLNLGFEEGSKIESVPVGLLGSFLSYFFIIVAAPIFEEILFRGFLYSRLRSVFKFWPAFLISGLFFSLLHADLGAPLSANIYFVLDTLLFSYFVTRTFEESGNLWSPIFFHVVYNGWLTILLAVFDAIESSGIS